MRVEAARWGWTPLWVLLLALAFSRPFLQSMTLPSEAASRTAEGARGRGAVSASTGMVRRAGPAGGWRCRTRPCH